MHPPFHLKFHSKWDIIDCLNGVLCLYYEGKVRLWNPSLRKFLILPKPKVLPVAYFHTIGFGFVGTNNYKIIRVSYPIITDPVSEAEVYEQRTGCWRDVELGDYSHKRLFLSDKQVHLDGVLHWVDFSLEIRKIIWSFDLKTERFGTLMVPSSLGRYDDGRVQIIPSTFRESLCLAVYRGCDAFDMWVMKEYGVAKSWQKLVTIAEDIRCLTTYPRFRHNGDILFGISCDGSVTGKLVCYDPNNKFKNLGYSSNSLQVVDDLYMCAYVESLVLINNPNAVEIYEESDDNL